ncbi:elastase-2A [Culex quinquefasciatus]|uniref:Elastase-2A n=1 Tax=Culex quinquefasciatus TaxID=7176 RepID=B0W9M4_CULQU|nr:elastase-2A [Culex quinquefasciatus]|eukprot:XP_001845408.1 elastase-2A [Culex quinquefasciatus]
MRLFPVAVALLLSQLIAADEGGSITNSLFRCGIRKRFGVQLILRGRTAELGQWPWHAAIYHGSSYKCGGTLIDQRHVLTSAHCVVDSQRRSLRPARIEVQLGKHDLRESSRPVKVSEVRVHEEFERNRNDIALLVLSSTVTFSELVIPICLEGIQGGDDLVDQRGWVVGWGETEDGAVSNQLKTASMPVVSNTECVQNDPDLFGRFISPGVFCASDRNGTSVCRGDSGGGMYILAGDRWELRGITSFAGLSETGSCDTKKFVVFTNVAYFYGWIKRLTMGGGEQDVDVPKRISEISELFVNIGEDHRSSSIISECQEQITMDVDWERLKVRLGGQADNPVKQEYLHPDYDEISPSNLIMLLELSNPLKFARRFLPTCLANRATENLYDTLLLTGFGGQSTTTKEFYESVDSRVVSNEQCQGAASKEELCVTDHYTGVRNGIVGGPLQTVNTRNCMFTQIGVAKNLQGNIKGGNVFSRVTAYLDWIEHVVWGVPLVVEKEAKPTIATTTWRYSKDFYFPDN